jgi:peptidoglycan/LPS O-acetylase OafA/YrhL
MKYRSEIDGLRAVAIVPVILFHAGFSAFSGGFVGVDVFFVISGYLITTIIINDSNDGSFSFSNFYQRRARRILPAFLFVIMCSIPLAWYLLIPRDMEDFAANVGTAAIFLSNFYLLSQAGYFGSDADLQPFVHTWSLSIEEQFYLIFPAIFIASLRISKRFAVAVVITCFCFSLFAAEWGWRFKPEDSYYHSLTRFWELLLGSLVAFYLSQSPVNQWAKRNNLLSAIGLCAIMYSVFQFDKNTPFPSIYTLIPTLGTALIIMFAVKGTWVQMLLSLRGAVGMGLISYSLYLWHQPLFAFWRHYNFIEVPLTHMAILSLICVLLALFTYHFIEAPFRRKAAWLSTPHFVFLSVLSVLGVFLFGLGGNLNNGFIKRLPENLQGYAIAANDKPNRECHYGANDNIPLHPVDSCLSADKPQVMLLGDSHAHALHQTFLTSLLANSIPSYSVSYSGCVPLLGFYRVDEKEDHLCNEFVEAALNYAKNSGIKTLVLAGRFPLYLNGTRFDNMEGGLETGEPAFIDQIGTHGSSWNDEGRRKRVLALYGKRITELSELFNVVLVQPIPEAGWDVPVVGMRLARSLETDITLSTQRSVYDERTRLVRNLFDKLEKSNATISVTNIQDELCDTKRCYNIVEGKVFYYDDDHLSSVGAELIMPSILNSIQQLNLQK